MFPTVRLTVVAILAAIAGIGCGLGLFATFRVNHEPLARLAEGSPPLQLAVDRLGLDLQARSPLEVRLPANGAANLNPIPLIPTAVPDQAVVEAAISGDSGTIESPAGGSADVDQSGAAVTVAAVVPTEQQSSAAGEASAAAPPQQEAVVAAGDQEPTELRNEVAASNSASHTEQIAAIDAAAPDEQPSAPPSEPAAVSAATASAEQMAAIDAAGKDQAPAPKSEKSVETKAAQPAAKAPHPAPARRAAKVVRARRTVTTVAAQPAYQYPQATYAQPTYTQPAYTQSTFSWADGTSQASPAAKRVQVKRHRAVRTTAPAAQSNTAPATAALGGGQ